MKLFLDSASLSEIKEAVSWGIIDGITTNPSLIKKAVDEIQDEGTDSDIESYIKKILATAGRMNPVSLEVAGLTAEEMFTQGMRLYDLFDQVAGNVVIKIPVSSVNSRGEGEPFDAIRAIKHLSEERVPVNATLIFTPEQALLAAKAGAEYVSPFAGRIDDRIRREAGIVFDKNDYFPARGMMAPGKPDTPLHDHQIYSGVDLVSRIAMIFQEYEMECEIIAASIRNPEQVREMAEVGAHITTIPFKVLRQVVAHPGTADGIDAFTADLVDDYTAILNTEDDGGE